MSWFNFKSPPKAEEPKKLRWWEKEDLDYPPGSEWTYLGKPCVVMRTHYWTFDGCPVASPQVQYVDDNGVIQTTEVALSALRPAGIA